MHRINTKRPLLVATALAVAIALAGMNASVSVGTEFFELDDATPGCGGNEWGLGIFDAAGHEGSFDLTLGREGARKATGIDLAATLCGTTVGIEGFDDRAYEKVVAWFPNEEEDLACALPEPAPTRCDRNGDGDTTDSGENIHNGAQVGNLVVDAMDLVDAIVVEHYYLQANDVSAEIRVRSSDDGNAHCDEEDEYTVGCLRAEATVEHAGELDCKSDIVIQRYWDLNLLSLYQPVCEVLGYPELSPTAHIDNLDHFELCKFAGCGRTGEWIYRNGAPGPYTFTLFGILTTGDLVSATAGGEWT